MGAADGPCVGQERGAGAAALAKRGTGVSEPTLRAAAWLRLVYFQVGPFRAMQGGSVQWAPGIAHEIFKEENCQRTNA